MTDLSSFLNEVRERLEKATPGPWEPCGARFSIVSSYLNPQEHLDICDTAIADLMPNEQATHNAYLIAHAPTDLTLLLKIVEEQRKALEFYSNENRYHTFYDQFEEVTQIDHDCGHVANQCIQRISSMLREAGR